MGRDLCTSEAGTCIETDAVATSTAVHLDFTGVWLEALSGILGGDTALDRETALGNSILGQTELGEGCTSSNLDLSSDDIESSDFLCGANSLVLDEDTDG